MSIAEGSTGWLPILVAVVILLLSAAGLLWRRQRRRAPSIDRAWAEAAVTLGAGPLAAGSRRFEAELDGVVVALERPATSAGVFTRLTATARAPRGMKLVLTHEAAAAGPGRPVDVEDVPIGDPDFDEAYLIQASDAEWAKVWLNATVRRHLSRVPSYRFSLAKGRVRAEAPHVETDPRRLVAAARAVAALADGRHRVLRSWQKLAARHGGTVAAVAERWATLELDGAPPVTVDTCQIREHHYTEASAALASPTTPFVLTSDPHLYAGDLPEAQEEELRGLPDRYRLFSWEPASCQSLRDGDVQELIDRLGPAKVRSDGQRVTVTWPGIATLSSELEEAVELTRRLARAC